MLNRRRLGSLVIRSVQGAYFMRGFVIYMLVLMRASPFFVMNIVANVHIYPKNPIVIRQCSDDQAADISAIRSACLFFVRRGKIPNVKQSDDQALEELWTRQTV